MIWSSAYITYPIATTKLEHYQDVLVASAPWRAMRSLNFNIARVSLFQFWVTEIVHIIIGTVCNYHNGCYDEILSWPSQMDSQLPSYNMNSMASQIISKISSVCSITCWGYQQRKHRCFALIILWKDQWTACYMVTFRNVFVFNLFWISCFCNQG